MNPKCLCLAGILLAFATAPVSAQFSDSVVPASIANVDAVPKIAPEVVIKTASMERPDQWKQRLKLTSEKESFHIGPEHNANTVYQQARPYPEMRYVLSAPRDPLAGNSFGVEAVEGFRRHWLPAQRPGTIGKEERVQLWRWQVPAPLKQSWQAWEQPSAKGRCAALVLFPAKWTERNPTLFYFDALSGLRWQQQIPLDETVRNAPSGPGAHPERINAHSGDMNVSATRDGSRVLVLVRRIDLDLSVLFVYDGSGTLRRTLLFPARRAEGIGRHYTSRDKFRLSFQHTLPSPQIDDKGAVYNSDTEYYSVEAEGNLLYRFVDRTGRGVPATLSDDEAHAYGCVGTAEFGFFHYLFVLPRSIKGN